MAMDVVSRHLRSSTELQLLVPVRNGFVEGSERLTSFATRLKLLLEALSDSFRVAWDRDRLLTTGPIDQLQTIQATQWGVRERPEGSLLLVSSCFDRSWEEYFHLLVDRTGPLLDAIFMHCEGFRGQSTAEGYEYFAKFIRDNQVQNSFFYMAAPDLSVDDLRRARKVLSGGHFNAAPIGSLQHEAKRTRAERAVEDKDLEQRLARSLGMSVIKLHMLRQLFPPHEQFDARSARKVFDGASANLLSEFINDPALAAVFQRLPAAEARWIDELLALEQERSAEAARLREPRRVELSARELRNIQGNILQPYNDPAHKVWHGCLVLVQCDDVRAARALLARVRDKLSDAEPCDEQGDHRYLNVALTYNGLRRLGVPEEALSELPAEFREGMEARAGLVGDVGYPNYPEFWQRPPLNWPAPPPETPDDGEKVALSSVDAVFLLQLRQDEREDYDAPWSSAHPLCEQIGALDLDSAGSHVLHVQLLRRRHDSHFKLPVVGESQPVPCATLAGRDLTQGVPARDLVPLGELLLGYEDSRGKVALLASTYADLFKNGTFLVLRKLDQDVQAFDTYLKENAALGDPDTIRGLILGRDREGNPLVTAPPADRHLNDFGFDDGVEGRHCPLHSHIRRTNPRPDATGERVPRIMRRSIPYGPSEQAAPGAQGPAPERGLMFMAYNASIATQFEILQRWINGANSTGLPSTQNDLLSGVLQPTGTAQYVYQNGQWLPLKQPSQPFVMLRWGLYLFVPSLPAVELLAHVPDESEIKQQARELEAKAASEGALLSARLNRLESTRALAAWKQVIEGGFSRQNEQVWAATRQGEGPRTAKGYGLLIGTEPEALGVLCDPGERYSVREYYRRLGETIGPQGKDAGDVHYLAHDPRPGGPVGRESVDRRHRAFLEKSAEPGYGALSGLPNEYILGLWQRPQLFERAHDHALAEIRRLQEHPPVSLRDVIKAAVAHLAHHLVGISDEPERRVALLENFILVSRYAFQPYPDETLRREAIRAGRELRGAYREYEGPMQRELSDSAYPHDRISAAIGAIVGFAAPAVASVLSALTALIQTGELARLQLRIRRAPEQLRLLAGGAFQSTQLRMPIPPLLYRSVLPGAPHGEAGDYVIVGLSSVAQTSSDPRQWLFGGHHGQSGKSGDGRPHHGCPASDPAFAMMSGILACFLRLPNVSPVSRLHIAIRGALPGELATGEQVTPAEAP